MKVHKAKLNNNSRQLGFSLVEIMIGLVIGLLATLVIVNVLTIFEKQKRTTTGNSDAQTNGAIALFSLQRDIQLAGYSMPVYDADFTPYKCGTENDANPANVLTYDHDESPATQAIGISPVVITDSVLGGSDQISIRTGSSPTGGIATDIYNIPVNKVLLDTNVGCHVGDAALLMNKNNTTCKMVRVTVAPAGTGEVDFTPSLTAADGSYQAGRISCLGRWNEIQYARNNDNEITRLDILSGGDVNNPPAIVPEVVSIQAQYGISALPQSNVITSWVNATGAWEQIDNAAARNSIKAIRVAIVARNGLPEAKEVSTTCSSITSAAPTGLCAWAGSVASPAPVLDLSLVDPNWKNYRYRVYESIIPIRNVIWSKDKLAV